MDYAPAMADRRWQPGEHAVVRYLTIIEEKPGDSWPARVIEDTDARVVLYLPDGTTFKRKVFRPRAERRPEGTLTHRDASLPFDTLRLMYPDRASSIWAVWERDAGGRRFKGWYVNMEEPYRRTAVGFDTNDHTLDILVQPDLAWTWKDAGELDDRVREGLYTPELATAVRAEGERIIEQIERREPPFSEGWEDWQPDPGWPLPELPENWATVPPELWSRRRWAYGPRER